MLPRRQEGVTTTIVGGEGRGSPLDRCTDASANTPATTSTSKTARRIWPIVAPYPGRRATVATHGRGRSSERVRQHGARIERVADGRRSEQAVRRIPGADARQDLGIFSDRRVSEARIQMALV